MIGSNEFAPILKRTCPNLVEANVRDNWKNIINFWKVLKNFEIFRGSSNTHGYSISISVKKRTVTEDEGRPDPEMDDPSLNDQMAWSTNQFDFFSISLDFYLKRKTKYLLIFV